MATQILKQKEIYQLGENKAIQSFAKRLGVDFSFENNPEIREIFVGYSAGLYNATKEVLHTLQEFITNPENMQTIAGITPLPASLAKGRITFNATAIGISMGAVNNLQGVNNQLYTILDTFTSQNVTLPIVNISSNGLGTVTVEVGLDITTIATGNKINISGVSDTDFNTTNVIANITSLRTLTYSKSIPLKSSSGGNVTALTLTVQAIAQEYGEIGNLSGGKVVNNLNPITNVSSVGYVNFTNITGGVSAETRTATNNRISAKLKNPTTTNNDANMKNIALTFPGTTRAWVNTIFISGTQIFTYIYHMRDNSVPAFPTAQDNENLREFLLDNGQPNAGIPSGRSPEQYSVLAPTNLEYDISFGLMFAELDNDKYKDTIKSSILKAFEQLELGDRMSLSIVKSVITNQTKQYYPDILYTDLDALINAVGITYDTGNTEAGVISTLGNIIYATV